MKKIALLLALLMALTCLTACGPKDQTSDVTALTEADEEAATETATEAAADAATEAATEAPAATDAAAPADTAQSESVAVPTIEISQSENTVQSDDGVDVLHTSYPVITVTGGPNAERLTQILDMEVSEYKGLTAKGFSGESESLEAEAKEAYQTFRTDDIPWDAPYSDELTAQVVRCDEKVICIAFTSYTFAGGVHGFSYGYGRCYNTATGERIMLDDLAAENVNLREWALATVLEMSRDESRFEKDMFFEGYEDDLSGVIDDDFLLDENGLVFSAAPYELAAYAYGNIDFTIPYADLAGVVQGQYLK